MRYFCLIALAALCTFPAYATNVSSADPNYPNAYDDIESEPLRDQFDKIINDIDNIWAAIESGGGGSLGPAPAHSVIAGPISGSPATPNARFLNGDDLPLPSASSIGGVRSAVVVPHSFLTGISTSGAPTQAQPAFSDISGNISMSQIASGVGASSSTFLRGDGTWATGTNGTPSGAAGGDLSGSYPNPSVISVAHISSGVLPKANGGTACSGANCYYGLPNFRANLEAVKLNNGYARVCFAGDSTFFGSWSTVANTASLITNSMPTQISNYLTTQFGIKSNWNGFIGDQGTTETFGAYDTRVAMGQWTQDSSVVSLGGRTYKTIIVNGTPLTFTPTTNVDTFRFLYIIQPGGGTLSVQVDNGTATTYSTSGTAGIGVATVSAGSVASHTIKFSMSAGSQVNFVGVSDAYDSTNGSVDIVNLGWPGAKASDWAVTASAYSPSNSTAWSALACDVTFVEDGINDWVNGVPVQTYATNMQTFLTGVIGGSGDVVLVTPVPSPSGNASISTQNSYVSQMYSIAASISIPVIDTYARWGSNTNGQVYNLINLNGPIHPNANGYAEEGLSIAHVLAAMPGQPDNPLGFQSVTNFPASITIGGNSLTIANANTPLDNASCAAGTIWWDTGFIYVCTASGTVKRAALSTF